MSATPAHLRELAGDMRAADAKEARLLGVSAKAALWRSWRNAIYRKVALVDGKTAAIWGLGGSFLGDVGYPWLITSPVIEFVPVAFLRNARREVASMLKTHRRLESYVDADYTRAIRFLGLLGFEVSKPEANGFCRVSLER